MLVASIAKEKHKKQINIAMARAATMCWPESGTMIVKK